MSVFDLTLSRYNTIAKLFLFGTAVIVVYCLRFHPQLSESYQGEHDTFAAWLLMVPTFVLALLVNQYFNAFEVSAGQSAYLL